MSPICYVYRTLYPRTDFLARVAEDIGTRARTPFLKGAVLHDPLLATLLSRFHECLAGQAPRAERESLLLETLARLITRHADPLVTPRPVGKERPAVRKAREYMETHFEDDVSLSKLADSGFFESVLLRAGIRKRGRPPAARVPGGRSNSKST
jgi:AraC-like ligand binding domain